MCYSSASGFVKSKKQVWIFVMFFSIKKKFICEISRNILYQYVFVVLWFVIIISIGVSVAGLIVNFAGNLFALACFINRKRVPEIFHFLSLTKREYLNFILSKDIPLYVMQKFIKASYTLEEN